MFENNENNELNNEPNKFGIPEGYFKKSANSIIQKIEWIEEHKIYPNLSSLKKESGFVVPVNYFNEKETKLELLEFPTLFSINKTNNFKIDENYFASTEEKINAALLNEKKEAKIVKLFSPKVWYAAAAVLTITLGLWIYNQYYKVEELKDCGTLACVDKFDLVKAKHLEDLDNEELYELVDTKKLEEKLKDNSAVKTENKTETKKEDLDTSLKNVSDEELLDEI